MFLGLLLKEDFYLIVHFLRALLESVELPNHVDKHGQPSDVDQLLVGSIKQMAVPG